MAVSKVHQREIVEVSFRFLDGVDRVHPALVVSDDSLQDAEDGMFYAVLISSKNIHPEYTIEIKDEDLYGGDGKMEKQSFFVTHFLAYFTVNDVISRRNTFVKVAKFNEVVDTIVYNIFGDEIS